MIQHTQFKNAASSPQTQSDAALHQQISSRLAQRGISVADRLTVEIQNGIVTVSGRVPTYYQRQLIVHAIRQIPAVREVVDSVEVVLPENTAKQRALTEDRGEVSRSSRPRRLLPIGAALAALITVSLASCSKPQNQIPVYPVEGKLTFDGEAATGAFLILHPVGHELPKTVRPTARVGQDGNFKLGTFSTGDGAPEGEYTLTVEWRKLVKKDGDTLPGPNVVPKQYHSPETSDLHVKVAKGKNEWEPLQLSAHAAEGNSVTK